MAIQHPGFTIRLDTVDGVPDVQHIQLPLTTGQFGVGCGISSGNAFVVGCIREANGDLCPGKVESLRFGGSMDQTTTVSEAFRLALDPRRANNGCNAQLNATYGTPLETRPSSITSPQDPIGYGYAVGTADAPDRRWDVDGRFHH